MKERGMTLLETILYIALLSLFLSGVLAVTFGLLEGSARTNRRTFVQEESTFVMNKIAWALSGLSSAPIVGGSPCVRTLTVSKAHYSGNPIIFRRTGNVVEMGEAGLYMPLSSEGVEVTCLEFSLLVGDDGVATGVRATTTLNGKDFTFTQWIWP